MPLSPVLASSSPLAADPHPVPSARVRATRGSYRKPFSPTRANLAWQLNEDWARLRTCPEAVQGPARWASQPGWPASAGAAPLDTLDKIVQYVQAAARSRHDRDVLLLHLIGQCQAGDQLAGRVVLQVMLPKAIRLARSVRDHSAANPVHLDDANGAVVAALWVAIASYPLQTRPGRVTANLALNTLAIAQRGHTGSSWRTHRVVEVESVPDVVQLVEPTREDPSGDDLMGPSDSQVYVLLAWAVRAGVLALHEARLLARYYAVVVTVDDASSTGSLAETRAALAAELGTSSVVLRQRCSRLTRRLGAAALGHGLTGEASDTSCLLAA